MNAPEAGELKPGTVTGTPFIELPAGCMTCQAAMEGETCNSCVTMFLNTLLQGFLQVLHVIQQSAGLRFSDIAEVTRSGRATGRSRSTTG